MNVQELKAEIARHNYTIPKLATEIGIGKKAMYDKIAGRTMFKQDEISNITKVLKLSNEMILAIFFADSVS